MVERIFNPFTTKGPGEGTGMGLAVVHGIVTAHGGIINVRTEPREGAAFHTYFPMHDIPEPAEQPEQEDAPGGAEPVAVFQTDEVIGAFVCASLRHQGYAVHDVRGLEASKEFLRRKKKAAIELGVVDTGLHAPGVEQFASALAKPIPECRLCCWPIAVTMPRPKERPGPPSSCSKNRSPSSNWPAPRAMRWTAELQKTRTPQNKKTPTAMAAGAH